MEDVHGKCKLGYCDRWFDCKSSYRPFRCNLLTKFKAYFWVETKGKTLEEIDAIFEGHKHSSVPDVEDIRTGKEILDVHAVEMELEKEEVEMKMG